MVVSSSSESSHRWLWSTIQRVLREQRRRKKELLLEDLSFYIYRSDTNAVLARGIKGYEAAKERANHLRKAQGLPWSVVKFKAERRTTTGPSGSSGGQQRRFGVSPDGKRFTNAYGQRSRVEYSPVVNPSKGRRFRGYTDAQGNYHDID